MGNMKTFFKKRLRLVFALLSLCFAGFMAWDASRTGHPAKYINGFFFVCLAACFVVLQKRVEAERTADNPGHEHD